MDNLYQRNKGESEKRILPSFHQQGFSRKDEIGKKIVARRAEIREKEAMQWKSSKKMSSRYWTYAAAMLVGGVLGTIMILNKSYTTTDSLLKLALSDKVSVELDKHSTLKYNMARWMFMAKTVELKGKASFMVVPGNSFEVHTTAGNVRALGTKFSIDQIADTMYVNCSQGKVSVSNFRSELEVVAPGSVRVAPGSIQIVKNNIVRASEVIKASNVPVFTKEYIEFDHVPVKQVFAEIERVYDIDIENVSVADNTYFTGVLLLKDLKSALEIVCSVAQVKYTMHDQNVVLAKKTR